jgi:hypothetical protein
MWRTKFGLVAIAVLESIATSACTTAGDGDDAEPTKTSFAAGATIGLLMPEQTSDNPEGVNDIFVSELEDAGFTVQLEEQHPTSS